VDAFAALTGCANGISEMNALNGGITLFPNPAEEKVNIYYSFPGRKSSQKYFIRISDVLGKNITQVSLGNETGYVSVPVENLSRGIYFCSLYAEDVLVESKKLVVK
jgi:hypothetical protein